MLSIIRTSRNLGGGGRCAANEEPWSFPGLRNGEGALVEGAERKEAVRVLILQKRPRQ